MRQYPYEVWLIVAALQRWPPRKAPAPELLPRQLWGIHHHQQAPVNHGEMLLDTASTFDLQQSRAFNDKQESTNNVFRDACRASRPGEPGA
jgi:hypothetical protein